MLLDAAPSAGGSIAAMPLGAIGPGVPGDVLVCGESAAGCRARCLDLASLGIQYACHMHIDLRRTFSEYKDASPDDEAELWKIFLDRQTDRLTWADLHERPLTVILGEAGIGKTFEFENEVDRLRAAGKAAFFLALNQLSGADSWDLALTGRQGDFANWAASDAPGYFFLDAVDEARLKSHADFERALTVVQNALSRHFSRAHIAISSRVTDWASPGVRAQVQTHLAKPIERALPPRGGTSEQPVPLDEAAADLLESGRGGTPVEALVVTLDPLSNAEAHRCAEAFGLADATEFWQAVGEGDYEFMASRPLDLKWMVGLWNQRKTLGSYRDLIEANVTNCLRELNDSYEAAGAVLSVDQLRRGAVELAAAAEFGGCAFFVLEPDAVPSSGELAPHSVLSDWGPHDVRRLMASAIFDEASFGRVKFHHRSVREYLAAQWVSRQLELGVPLLRLQGLFAGRPYDVPVLIPTRRAALSWLAAIDVEAREWVVRDFPEILLYGGDPQSWDGLSVDKAFDNFLAASKRSLQVNWPRNASQWVRVGKALSAGKVAAAMVDPTLPAPVRSLCFHMARHAKLDDCASPAFDIYRNTTAPDWERRSAVAVLQLVATSEQRNEILADLQAHRLGSNELLAPALSVVDWRRLAVTELSAIFDSTQGEGEFGSGPMAQLLKYELLPEADLSAAVLLLSAAMASLLRPATGLSFPRFSDSDRRERAWVLSVFPACLERVLALLQPELTSYMEICTQAAARIEVLRAFGLTDGKKVGRLRTAIAQHPALRQRIALAIAESGDIPHAPNRLAWDSSCIVGFDASDLPELTHRANDATLQSTEQEVWFAIAMAIAFKAKRGRERTNALRALGLHGVTSQRGALVGAMYGSWREGAAAQRRFQSEQVKEKAKKAHDLEAFKTSLTEHLPQIREGSHFGGLQRLLEYAFIHAGERNHSAVHFDRLATDFGLEVAEAFRDGLMAFWPMHAPPDPANFPDGQVPWSTIVALAGLRLSLGDLTGIASIQPVVAAKAAQWAVWALNSPPSWFEPLARAHSTTVDAVLTPWILAEAQSTNSDNRVRGALAMALRCAPDVRRRLLAPLVPRAMGGGISQPETCRAVIEALRADGELLPDAVRTLCQTELAASIGPTGRLTEMSWLRLWMETDATGAWAWFAAHVHGLSGDVEPEVSAFAAAVVDLKWVKAPLDHPTANVLLGIHAMLSAHPPAAPIAAPDDDSHFLGPPSKRLRDAIPTLFLEVRGPIGHRALVSLLPGFPDPMELNWMNGLVTEHASLDAAQDANRSASDLRSIASAFHSEPRTEAQLYEQALARLEEIRKNLEEGPFSERDLFSPSMPEKFLQRWLAAKFRETQSRRFSVHREEEVDDDNKTDIQLSCPAGNVCVEIKPVDSTRSYSAKSLTETLRTQIVGQYLRGTNSTRGILVLMQLDNKTWNIPSEPLLQPFQALVRYLQTQADAIKAESTRINELTVFGIRCVV